MTAKQFLTMILPACAARFEWLFIFQKIIFSSSTASS